VPATGNSYFHRGGDTPLLGATIAEHFASTVTRFPHHEAVISIPQGRRLSYAQLADAVDPLARGLLAIGFNKGDHIGVWATNNLEWLLLQIATARIGAVLVTINPAYRPRELAYALQRSEIKGLFVIPRFRSSDYVAMLVELMPELQQAQAGKFTSTNFPALRQVVIYDPAAAENTPRPHPGFTTWADLLSAAEAITAEQLEAVTDSLDMDDPINI